MSKLTPAPATPASASTEEGTIVQVVEFDMVDVEGQFCAHNRGIKSGFASLMKVEEENQRRKKERKGLVQGKWRQCMFSKGMRSAAENKAQTLPGV